MLMKYNREGTGLAGEGIVYPHKTSRVIQNVPEKVAFNYDQALRAQSTGALNATAVMAKTSIGSIRQDLGAVSGNLETRLENLKGSARDCAPFMGMGRHHPPLG